MRIKPYLTSRLIIPLLLALGLPRTLPAATDATVFARDASGREVRLPHPAQRVISLAPNLTEMMFAVGAGAQLIGAADHSDFPPPARQIPRIGGYDRFDPETVIALRPDLVLGWSSGNPSASLELLERFGLTVFKADPLRLDEIPLDLERLGTLTGHVQQAATEAQAFRTRLAALRTRHRDAPRVRMFYQVWHQPLMTINGVHLISDVMTLCGGENVFASLPALAPVIDLEAVLAANPEVIVASGMDEQRPEWLDHWREWQPLTAVIRNNLFFIPPDLLQRHTPRILDGAERLCPLLETARQRRPGIH
ncbi:MAG: cobalamin-binding protein [Magnetococcales bacterium]|nr:cobalamin-binding protein [Magnetococcales bacterium]